jgi:hypothetical protein
MSGGLLPTSTEVVGTKRERENVRLKNRTKADMERAPKNAEGGQLE